jgi:hypothetical protein
MQGCEGERKGGRRNAEVGHAPTLVNLRTRDIPAVSSSVPCDPRACGPRHPRLLFPIPQGCASPMTLKHTSCIRLDLGCTQTEGTYSSDA